jgi:hypothetical protein
MTTTELIADIEARLDVGNILPVHIRVVVQFETPSRAGRVDLGSDFSTKPMISSMLQV